MINDWLEEDIFYDNSNLNYVIRTNYSWGIENLKKHFVFVKQIKTNQLLRIQPVCQIFNILARYLNRIQGNIPQKYFIKYMVTFLAWILLPIFVSDKE